MANQVQRFTVTVAAGTPLASPATFDLSFPPSGVDRIDVRIPPGPLGNVGFQIGSSGQPVMPFNAGAFIVGNDELIVWPLTNLWDSGNWTMFAYNTGSYPHTLEVRFLLTSLGIAPGITQDVTAPGSGSAPIEQLVGMTALE